MAVRRVVLVALEDRCRPRRRLRSWLYGEWGFMWQGAVPYKTPPERAIWELCLVAARWHDSGKKAPKSWSGRAG